MAAEYVIDSTKVMNIALKAHLKELIKSKRGFAFEEFINELLLIQHGANGYQPTRARKDDGAEGLVLSTRTIIAAYGPDTYHEGRFIKKVNGDFDEYLKKWANRNPNWHMYYNNALAPEQLRKADDLLEKAKLNAYPVNEILIKGIDQIMQILDSDLTNTQLRQIGRYLGIPRELMIFDSIRSLIDDLIRGVGVQEENVSYKLKVDVAEKIKLNYSEADIKMAEEEFFELNIAGTLKKIWQIIGGYEVEQVNILKLKIKRDFNSISGNFKQKLESLIVRYLEKYSSGQDDDYEYYVRALLVYCFEQCLIGEKTYKEQEN